jgi:hypothetical protein
MFARNISLLIPGINDEGIPKIFAKRLLEGM